MVSECAHALWCTLHYGKGIKNVVKQQSFKYKICLYRIKFRILQALCNFQFN